MAQARRGYYFETQDEMTGEELNKRLAQAGLRPEGTARTTLMHEGMVFSEELASAVWTEKTHLRDCNGSCEQEEKVHTRWEELDGVQKELFAETLARFMNEGRLEDFDAEASLGHRAEFGETALQTDLRKRAPGPEEIARRKTERAERQNLRFACIHRLAAGRKRCTRKGLQHTAYILQEGMGAPTGFQFKNLYGPVSDDLDASVTLMTQMGFLLETREESGAGTETTLTAADPAGNPLAQQMQDEWDRAAAPWAEQIARILEIYGDMKDLGLHRQTSMLMIQHTLTERDKKPPGPQETLAMARMIMRWALSAQLKRDLEEMERLGLFREKPHQATPGNAGGRPQNAGHDGG